MTDATAYMNEAIEDSRVRTQNSSGLTPVAGFAETPNGKLSVSYVFAQGRASDFSSYRTTWKLNGKRISREKLAKALSS